MSRLGTHVRFALVLTVGIVAGFGLSIGRTVKAEREIEPEPKTQSVTNADAATAPVPWQDARLLAEVLEHVRREYVDRISDQELIEAAIRGLIADLDPHSAYLDPEQFDEIRISTTGEYSGVGIEVALENGAVKVINPIEDTPAYRAGVLAGDRILAVDDVPVNVENLNDTIDRMRGRIGTPVKITIARGPDPKPMQFTLARASVLVHSVSQEVLEPGIGYVKITNFSETTTPDLEITDWREPGAPRPNGQIYAWFRYNASSGSVTADAVLYRGSVAAGTAAQTLRRPLTFVPAGYATFDSGPTIPFNEGDIFTVCINPDHTVDESNYNNNCHELVVSAS